jgi:hypothetical protein
MCAAAIPDVQDQKLNSHSKLNCITACIQATKAGADEALMLDPHGFVATCNSTHFFIVRRGELWTSTGQYCIPGITRGNIMRVARDDGIPVFEKVLLALRRLRGRRGLRHRHVRRARAGARGRRADHRPSARYRAGLAGAGTDGAAAGETLRRVVRPGGAKA